MAGSLVFAVVVGGRDYSRVAQNVTFSNVDPGGYEMCSIDILSNASLRVNPGDKIRIYDGAQVVWEGRVAEPQKNIKHAVAATLVGGEGYGAALKDNQMSMVYVDRDLTRWQPMSRQRQINILNAGSNSADTADVRPDTTTGTPVLATHLTGPWVANSICEAFYDAGPNNALGSLFWSFTIPTDVNSADPAWSWAAYLSTDDIFSSYDGSGNIRAASGSGTVVSNGPNQSGTWSPRRFAALQQTYANAAGQNSQLYPVFWTIAVYGNHGLPLQGIAPQGIYPSDIARDATLRAFSAGAQIRIGQIDTITNPIIQHYVQYTPVDHEQIIADMAKQAACHYGTWESLSPFDDAPRFDFRAYPTQPTVFCSLADCDEIDLSERLSALYNRARITWQDAAGTPGNITVALPLDLLDQNAIIRTATYDLGTSSQAAAQTFGVFVLQLLYAQQRGAGSVTLPRRVRTAGGALIPAHWLKAGLDRIRINDLPFRTGLLPAYDTDAFRISRVECTVGADGIPITRVELDQGPNLIETLQARLEIATKIAGG